MLFIFHLFIFSSFKNIHIPHFSTIWHLLSLPGTDHRIRYKVSNVELPSPGLEEDTLWGPDHGHPQLSSERRHLRQNVRILGVAGVEKDRRSSPWDKVSRNRERKFHVTQVLIRRIRSPRTGLNKHIICSIRASKKKERETIVHKWQKFSRYVSHKVYAVSTVTLLRSPVRASQD